MEINFLSKSKEKEISKKKKYSEREIDWTQPSKDRKTLAKENNKILFRKKKDTEDISIKSKEKKGILSKILEVNLWKKNKVYRAKNGTINNKENLEKTQNLNKSRKEMLKFISQQKGEEKINKLRTKENHYVLGEKKDKKDFWLKISSIFKKKDKKLATMPKIINGKASASFNKEKIVDSQEIPKEIRKTQEVVKPEPAEKEIDLIKKNKEEKGIWALITNLFNNKKKKPKVIKTNTDDSLKNIMAGSKSQLEEKEKNIKDVISPSPSKSESDNEEAERRDTQDVLETNLIKDEVTVFFDWQKNIIVMLIVVILSCAVIGGSYWGLLWWAKYQRSKILDFTSDYNKLNKEIKEAEEEANKIMIFKKKLNLVSTLLSRHIYWTNFFNFLEKNSLADVYYLNFSGDNKGKYTLAAIAKDFQTIEAQVKELLSDSHVLDASVTQGSLSTRDSGDKGVNFNIELSLDPKIFIE
ncbi:MAG: hypothetical protein ABIE43_02865 [Patescibacteria group bacterium]